MYCTYTLYWLYVNTIDCEDEHLTKTAHVTGKNLNTIVHECMCTALVACWPKKVLRQQQVLQQKIRLNADNNIQCTCTLIIYGSTCVYF